MGKMNGSSHAPSLNSDIIYVMGRLEARVEHLSDRVEALEARTEPPASVTFRDVLPYMYGLLILLAAMTGRITWGQAIGLLGSGG